MYYILVLRTIISSVGSKSTFETSGLCPASFNSSSLRWQVQAKRDTCACERACGCVSARVCVLCNCHFACKHMSYQMGKEDASRTLCSRDVAQNQRRRKPNSLPNKVVAGMVLRPGVAVPQTPILTRLCGARLLFAQDVSEGGSEGAKK